MILSVIAKAKRALAFLWPAKPRRLDCWRGQVTIADDFDELPAEVAPYFR
jgi:hypothetical protein